MSQQCSIVVYNCTAQDVNMTMSCGVSIAGNVVYPAPQTVKVVAYQSTPYSYVYNATYPYNTFTFVGNSLFGQTDYYVLSRQLNVQKTAETQTDYKIYIGVNGKFVAADGSDITSQITQQNQNDQSCSPNGNNGCTCGYVYLTKYPSWFVDGIEALTGITVKQYNYLSIILLILVIFIIGIIVFMVIKKARSS